MDRQDQISLLLAENFGDKADSALHTKLEDLSLDSMDLVDLITQLEDIIGVEVDNLQEIDFSQTVGEFITALSTDVDGKTIQRA